MIRPEAGTIFKNINSDVSLELMPNGGVVLRVAEIYLGMDEKQTEDAFRLLMLRDALLKFNYSRGPKC